MVWKQNGINGASTRRTYLHAAGAALGVAALASGTAAAGDDDKTDAREPKKTDEEFSGIRPLRLIDEPGTYKLTEDLHIGEGDTGILIIANDVVLDGNGNTIAGDGAGTGINVADDIGGGADDVTIEQIVLKDLDIGITLFEPRRTRIRDNIVKNSDTGFRQDNDTASTVLRNNRFVASQVDLGISTGSIIVGNTITDVDQAGLELTDVSTTTVIDNKISDTDGPGILVEFSFTNRFLLNTITDNSGAGIAFDFSDDNEFRLNTVTDNGGAGFELDDSDDNLLVDNDLSDNADGPCDVDDESTDNTFSDNDPACEA